MTIARVLTVAGSDSGGGAGIQADIKTITALGGYAATAITAITVQDTLGVYRAELLDPELVSEQMRVVLADLGADAIKTGMLGSTTIARAVARTVAAYAPRVPLIVDPVMVAKGGASLLTREAEQVVLSELLPRASLVTPNAPEAEALTGLPVRRASDLERAAARLVELGAGAALVKGGHLEGDTVVDVLVTADGDAERFESPRLLSLSTHGTGCTLASAVALGIAEGLRLRDAVERARAYVARAIALAPGFGSGQGPLDHAHPLRT